MLKTFPPAATMSFAFSVGFSQQSAASLSVAIAIVNSIEAAKYAGNLLRFVSFAPK